MRNLIICCDGTWNTPDQKQEGIPTPTNVCRLFNTVADTDSTGKPQLKYYHPGVGTDGTWWERLAGGGVGVGLSKNIKSAYKWLGVNYQPGDKIFLFGYSRGAYTVRSTVGMISCCGLLNLTGLDDEELWQRVERVYKQGYRERKNKADWARVDWAFHSSETGASVPISFLGVWDTVGALGVPDDMTILNLLDDSKWYAFHDTKLSSIVQHARHAVALDERRASFTPTLWADDIAAGQDVKQVWFPGTHGDVGGGCPQTGLSNGALKWMMDEALDLGLAFQNNLYNQVTPNYQDIMHDSCAGLYKYLRTQPRSVPLLAANGSSNEVHVSVQQRQANPPITQAPYRPTILLKKGESKELSVFAALHWNETTLYLEAGAEYEFKASGQWLDRTIKSGPAGTADGKFQFGEVVHLAASLLGNVESGIKKVTKNEQADLSGTRRLEKQPWFALVGAIANGGNPTPDGTPQPHEIIPIKDGCQHLVTKPGYLYCFANDAWHFYDNNRGSVTLTVTRLS